MTRRLPAVLLMLFAALVVSFVDAQEATTRATPSRPQAQFFDSDGVKIRYIMAGEGEPVILIHGFTASAVLNWQQPGVFDALAENYQVVALDNRGHGASGKPREADKYGVEMVRDILRLMDHLGLEKAHLVGYSMGGFITNKLVSLHPERAITATLGGAGWTREGDQQFEFLDELATSLEEGRGIGPLVSRLTPEGQPAPTEEQIAAMNSLLMLTNDPKALAAVARGMAQLAVPEEAVRQNKVPMLAIIGEIDPLKVGVDELKLVMPDLEVVVIEEADHMNAFRDPRFIEALEDFLAEHSSQEAVAAGK